MPVAHDREAASWGRRRRGCCAIGEEAQRRTRELLGAVHRFAKTS